MKRTTVPVMKSVELPNGVAVPYAEQGDTSGYPVVLLHAIADSWRSFERVLSDLPESIHAFALTQRGHGDASRPARGYHSRDFAADLAAFMDALHLEAAVVVGGSSGGFVARRFAIDHPERTLGLVLLGSPAILRDKPGVLEMWDSTISELKDPISPDLVREFAEGTLTRPVPQAFLETIVQENLKAPARVWRATFEGLLEDDSLEELDKIKAPTLIVWGDRDAILPRSDQETLATAITGSRLLVYPGAGHAFYWEDPGRVASDLAAFIAELETKYHPSEGRINRMSVERNKATFRRYIEEVWKDEQLDIADEIFAEKYLSHQSDGTALERGPEDVKKFVMEYRTAFSDIEDIVEDMIGEGDRVVTRWTLRVTHTGEFRGIPATGKRITITGIGIFRFSEEGKVVESWDSLDQLGMLRQLGVPAHQHFS
ncbi:MAG TPA: alpha/beta fold hydrolase [Rubrobacter sp.]|jgi:non-heme chloroperoxidase|nr:alpha/beta fold hydrolase [Rubrobacter sp.]